MVLIFTTCDLSLSLNLFQVPLSFLLLTPTGIYAYGNVGVVLMQKKAQEEPKITHWGIKFNICRKILLHIKKKIFCAIT